MPTFTPDGATVLFLRSPPRSAVQSLFAFDVATGKTRELLTPKKLLAGAKETLSVAEKARLERQRISARGFTHFRLSEDGKKVLVGLAGKLYVVELAGGKVQPLEVEGAIDAKFSPDAKQVSYVKGEDLYAVRLATGRERRITRGGTKDKTHALAEFVAQEEMHRFSGYWWSPDGKTIAYEEADLTPEETFHIEDALHPEDTPVAFRYPRAGKANAIVRLGLIRATGGATRWIRWDHEKYPYLAAVSWSKKAPLTVLVQNRTQTEEVVLAVDGQGRTRPLLTERDKAWLNLEPPFPAWLPDGSGFLWYTERDGAPAVELRGKDGARVDTLIPKEARFESWSGFDDATGEAYFTAAVDPTQSVLYRVKRGGKPEPVDTGHEGPRVQRAVLSKHGGKLLVYTSPIDAMPRYEVFDEKGRRVGALPSVTEAPPFSPKLEIRKVGAGEGFWAEVIRPRNFVKGQKLPTIVEVYGGPTAQMVRSSMRENLLSQWIADQGFLVVKFDNRGTPNRGRAWEKAVKFDFAGPTMDDQVKALHALAKELPELDLARVGMEGWSFGGYMSALSVLSRGDVYKAAVAGAPVVDWQDYDTHYTERYLGLPEQHPDAYKKSSLLTYAGQLERPLLIIHGTADDNVYFFHSLKLSNALFRAGRPHDLLPLAGFTHMVPDPLVTERLYQRVVGFFRKNL